MYENTNTKAITTKKKRVSEFVLTERQQFANWRFWNYQMSMFNQR